MARDLALELKLLRKTLRAQVRLEASKRGDAILASADPMLTDAFWREVNGAAPPGVLSLAELETWVEQATETLFPPWVELRAALPESANGSGRTDELRRARDREYQRRKYATDPAARERKRLRNAKRYA